MRAEYRGDWGTLLVETEMIDVSSALPRPDPRWTFTDEHGHEHHREGDGYPTLVVVAEEPYWCPDCEDEHTDSHYECPLCGDHITPGTVGPSLAREYIPGMTSYLLNDQPISPEEARRILGQADATA